MEDPRKEWMDHANAKHPKAIERLRAIERPRAIKRWRPSIKKRYGDGGRENLIPRNGTFLKRLVEQLSINGTIQERKEAAGVVPYSGSHYAKEFSLGKSKNKTMQELEEAIVEQYDDGTVEDETMGGCEGATGGQYMEGGNHHAKEKGHKETAVEAMGYQGRSYH